MLFEGRGIKGGISHTKFFHIHYKTDDISNVFNTGVCTRAHTHNKESILVVKRNILIYSCNEIKGTVLLLIFIST